jgi:hypothetical protein
VTAGLKWPPDVEAQVMMANAIPRPKAQPIWKRELKAGEASFRTNVATDEMPAYLSQRVRHIR